MVPTGPRYPKSPKGPEYDIVLFRRENPPIVEFVIKEELCVNLNIFVNIKYG